MDKRKCPVDVSEEVIPSQSQLAADVVKLALELSGALHRAQTGGVQIEVEVETVAVAGRPSLQQVMAYVISFDERDGEGSNVRLRTDRSSSTSQS